MIQANINDRYAQLSQQEKAELIGIYTRAGYRDLASIIAHYNSCGGKLHASGGPVTNTAQYRDDSYLYNPPVDVGAPIEVPLRYRPLPDYGDYQPQTTSGMVEEMPINLNIEIPERGYGVLLPEQPVTVPALDARKDAARRIMAVENSKNNANGGYDAKTGRWYPHKSHEGGADTIGYGIKLSNGTPEAALALKQGYLTDEQAVSAVDTLVQKYYDAAKKVYDGKYGAGEWDKLSDKSQSILVDYSYNPGLSKFPSLMEGFHSGDLDLIKKNYKRYSGGKPLGRNKTLLEEIEMLGNEYPIFRKNGGSIHIKPSHRGRLTELKERTGKTEAELYNDGNPAHKKMVVFARNARKWKHEDGGPLANYLDSGGPYGVMPLGDDYLSYLQSIPEVSGGTIDPVVVTAALPAKFNGSQEAARRYAEGYQKGAKPVSEAMNRAGQDIFNAVDTVVGLTPTPAGAISWLGHMGADAAEGEWGKVGRDLGMAAALGAGARGVSWLKNYVDDATNFGEDIFRAFTDSAPGRVSTNFTYLAPAARASMETVPIVEKAVSAPYEIENLGGGYMLKSLMRGNPLEKQISKNGTVNVNNVRALVGKGSKVEQAVVDKVLASEEFAGKKAIDYNKFRKAVQDELITYERTPDTRFKDYGLDRIGYPPSQFSTNIRAGEMFNEWANRNYENIGYLSDDILPSYRDKNTGEIISWNDLQKKYRSFVPGSETYTFSSSRIPNGSGKHYNPNTIGHSRTYTTSDEPDVLHVMESQSDWAQSGKAQSRATSAIKNAEDDVIEMQKKVSDAESAFERDYGAKAPNFNPNYNAMPSNWSNQQWLDYNQLDNYRYYLKNRQKEVERLRRFDYEGLNQQYLADNYTSRQIQENLRYAAEKDQKKMRYPTRETAAKIEGYSKSRSGAFELEPELRARYDDFMASRQQKINDIIHEFAPEGYIDDYLQRWEEIPDEAIEVMSEAQRADLQRRSKLSWDFEKSEAGKKMKDDINRVYREYDERKWLDENVPETYLPQHETILRKYDAFPKQYQKLYKGADVRTVTDPNGNTWYEVDVPENYLQQEWTYKNGGRLKEFNSISSLF